MISTLNFNVLFSYVGVGFLRVEQVMIEVNKCSTSSLNHSVIRC